MSEPSLDDELRDGIHALGLDPSEGQLQQLLDYLVLLQKWNRVYNLTAVRDPAQICFASIFWIVWRWCGRC